MVGVAPASYGLTPAFELGNLTLRLLAGAAVALLDLTDQLIAPSFDDRPVVVIQATPLLLVQIDAIFL